MELSKYQLAIYDAVALRSGNLAVNAVAGSGKTFTMTGAVKTKIPSFYSVQMAAFGRDIAEVLRGKGLPPNVTISTYNAFGWQICRKVNRRLPPPDADKTEKILRYQVLKVEYENKDDWRTFVQIRNPITRLVSLLKCQLVFNPDEAKKRLPELCEHFNIDIPDDPRFFDLAAETYERAINDTTRFDFNDQIFQVHYQGYSVPAFDYVVVDEFQDTNDMEAQLMMKCSQGGLFYCVGDPDQAIYGFRGATPDAFGKFVRAFNAKVLPLSICYRCPKAVVKEAQSIVPRIEAAPGAKEGTLDSISTPEFLRMVQPGDFVLCRTVAPLVKRCLQGIRNKVPGFVFGREIGQSMEWLIDKVGTDSMAVDVFYDKLTAHVESQLAHYKITNKTNAALALEDRYETVVCLMEGKSTVKELKDGLKSVFKEDGNGVKYMTCHKSKGLENPKVFLLRPDLIPHPRSRGTQWMEEEESRLHYVTVTRSQDSFFYVQKEKDEK